MDEDNEFLEQLRKIEDMKRELIKQRKMLIVKRGVKKARTEAAEGDTAPAVAAAAGAGAVPVDESEQPGSRKRGADAVDDEVDSVEALLGDMKVKE